MRAILILTLLLTAGCTAAPPAEEPVPVSGEGRCDATAAQALVGRQATAELSAEALRLTGARALRWIRPGDVVTMDFRTDRLNIKLDASNRVESLSCG